MIENILTYTFPAAFALLPRVMDTPQARAMLLAIGLQESKFRHRKQVGGPAMGFWQFERAGGVKEILTSADTIKHVEHVCSELLYTMDVAACYAAIQHNDVLACCFARLLLWRDSRMLPLRNQPEKGWMIYLANWRPGKPHPNEWDGNFAKAWSLVQP